LFAQGLSAPLGQQVIVENRAGFLSIETVARAQPDGYSMLVYSTSLWIVPLLRRDLSWDAVRDFTPITLAASTPTVLVVHPSVPANSIKELIALAKARPGTLNYGSSAAGSANHLAAELFKSMAGVDLVQIPYKGAGPALNGLMGAEVQLMFPAAGSVAPHIKSGRLRALAVANLRPSALLPGVPTVAESGLPGYELVTVTGIFGPAGVPAAIVDRLNQEIVRILNRPEIKERLFNAALEVVGGSGGQLTLAMKSEIARFGKLIRDAGIKGE
jgi:tripartite-type tricarboxylate transporter receptor subunit TctC